MTRLKECCTQKLYFPKIPKKHYITMQLNVVHCLILLKGTLQNNK